MRKLGLLLAAGMATVLATTGCGAVSDLGASTVPDRGLIGISMPTVVAKQWPVNAENMVKQFGLLGYETDSQNAEDDVQAQVAHIDAMIDKGAKALVIGAVDGTALKGVLAKAAAADIPVISYDRLIRDSGDISYYAGFDNFKVGVLQGTYLVDTLGLKSGKGPFHIELFAGSADDNNATFFFNGAMSVLTPYIKSGSLIVKSGETAFGDVVTKGWDPATAKARMTRLLAGPAASVQVHAVLAPNDGLARAIVEALKAAGYGAGARKLPVISGQDAEVDSIKAIVAGEQGQTVYKDTRELAKVAVQMVNSLLNGGTPVINDTTQYHNGVKDVPSFLLQPISVDKTNYRRVLVDGGYYTADQIGG